MVENHLSRLASPKSWNVRRKTTKWIARPKPGPHSLNSSLTLSFFLKDVLEYAKTTKEVNTILDQGNVLVDGQIRKERKFPIGFMDIIEIPKLNECYRIIFDSHGRISLMSISKNETKNKLLKIIRKNVIKKGRMQLTFHDGKNILVDKFNGFVGDSIIFDLDKKTIGRVLSLEKGSLVYLSGGSHVGSLGKVKDIIKAKDLQKPKVVVEINGNDYITNANYAFVVGKDKPEIILEAKK